MSEGELSRFWLHGLSAISYLRDRSIIHGDIKPKNMLVSKAGRMQIADFGLASFLDCSGRAPNTGCGTPSFQHVFCRTFEHKKVTSVTDLWSLAVSVSVLATGYLPYETTLALQQAVRPFNHSINWNRHLSAKFEEFIRFLVHNQTASAYHYFMHTIDCYEETIYAAVNIELELPGRGRPLLDVNGLPEALARKARLNCNRNTIYLS